MRALRNDPIAIALRVLVPAGLLVDAVVHLRLASGYQLAQPDGVGQGNLFRIEAALAVLSAAFVLLRGTRAAFLTAAAVGLGGLVAVVLYRYVHVPALGPIPSMYEPVWYFQKSVSTAAAALSGLLALAGATRTHAD